MATKGIEERTVSGSGFNIGICRTKWNSKVVNSLVEGCKLELMNSGVDEANITIIECPGAFELPFTAKQLIQSLDLDAVICIGCLIKGDTMHFEYICQAVSHGIMELNLRTGVPVLFGVLTVVNEDQALQRAGLTEDGRNHGVEWAQSALEMAHLRKATVSKNSLEL